MPPGITIEQAQAEMDVVATCVGQQYPETKEWGIRCDQFADAAQPAAGSRSAWIPASCCLLSP
jgi:hypothetical protein